MMCGHAGCPWRVLDGPAGWGHVDTHGAKIDHDAVPPTAADQPATEPSAREVVESEVWAWLNRHDAPWSPSRLKVLDLTDAIEKALASAPQPAADTETEVQWGVRERPLVHGVTLLSTEDDARGLARRDHGVVVTRTVTTTTTPWEEA